jgi:integrase
LLGAASQNKSPFIYAFIRIALLTGMRCGEILALQLRQLDLKKRELRVGRAKWPRQTAMEPCRSSAAAVGAAGPLFPAVCAARQAPMRRAGTPWWERPRMDWQRGRGVLESAGHPAFSLQRKYFSASLVREA